MAKHLDDNTAWTDRKHFMWFPWTFTKYELKNDRIYTQRGLLSTQFDEILLYRIVDISMTRTLSQKIFGTGTIILKLKVDSDPIILLENIKRPKEVNMLISELVEEVRNRKNVVGKEFYSHNDELPPPPGDGEFCDHPDHH